MSLTEQTISLESAFFDFDPAALEARKCSYYVIHTRPRQEKKCAAVLEQRLCPFFLPLYSKPMERKTGRGYLRKYDSLLPVFAGYLFARLDEEDKKHRKICEATANFITVIPSATRHFLFQLDQLRRALDSEYIIAPYENFEHGTLVKITGGSLKGLEGYIVDHKGKQIFVIEIDMLGRGVSINVDAGFLKKVH